MKQKILAHLHLVDHSLYVEISEDKLHVPARQSISVVHQIAVQNALLIKTVLAR